MMRAPVFDVPGGVAPRQSGPQNVQARVPGGESAMASGIQRAASGLVGLAQGIEKYKYETDVTAAGNMATYYQTKIGQGFVQFKGLVGDSATEESSKFYADMDAEREAAARGLSNDRQRIIFLKSTDPFYIATLRGAESHVLNEGKRSVDASISAAKDAALKNLEVYVGGDLGLLDEEISRIHARELARAPNKEAAAAVTRDFAEKAYAGVILKQLEAGTNEGVDLAEKFLAEKAPVLSPQVGERLAALAGKARAKLNAYGLAKRLIGESVPPGAQFPLYGVALNKARELPAGPLRDAVVSEIEEGKRIGEELQAKRSRLLRDLGESRVLQGQSWGSEIEFLLDHPTDGNVGYMNDLRRMRKTRLKAASKAPVRIQDMEDFHSLKMEIKQRPLYFGSEQGVREAQEKAREIGLHPSLYKEFYSELSKAADSAAKGVSLDRDERNQVAALVRQTTNTNWLHPDKDSDAEDVRAYNAGMQRFMERKAVNEALPKEERLTRDELLQKFTADEFREVVAGKKRKKKTLFEARLAGETASFPSVESIPERVRAAVVKKLVEAGFDASDEAVLAVAPMALGNFEAFEEFKKKAKEDAEASDEAAKQASIDLQAEVNNRRLSLKTRLAEAERYLAELEEQKENGILWEDDPFKGMKAEQRVQEAKKALADFEAQHVGA